MIVITTPTGLIGAQVLSNVLGSGEPVRVIARDPSRLPAQVRERVEVVPGSHGDIGVVDRAFAGADAVFWLVPPVRTRTALRPLPGADDALVHGQLAPPGTGDQAPGHVLHADLRRPQAAVLRHPRHRRHRRPAVAR